VDRDIIECQDIIFNNMALQCGS